MPAAVVAGVVALSVMTLPANPVAADEVRQGQQWYLDELDVARAHEVSRGAGVTVAVIDTGIDNTHPDLRGNVLSVMSVLPPGDPGQPNMTEPGHGTHIASLIAGHGHGPEGNDGIIGVAPEASILPITVGVASLPPPPGYEPLTNDPFRLGPAIRQAVDAGAQVICIPLAITGVHAEALEYAVRHDVVVVTAGGRTRENAPSAMDFILPAGGPELGAITVWATGRNGEIWAGAEPPQPTAESPTQLVTLAPGVDTVTAHPGGGYTTSTGNGNAAALAAGTIALIRSAHPQIGHSEIFSRFLDSLTPQSANPGWALGQFDYATFNAYTAIDTPERRPATTRQTATRPDEQVRNQPSRAEDGTPPWLAPLIVAAVLVGLGAEILVIRRSSSRSSDTN